MALSQSLVEISLVNCGMDDVCVSTLCDVLAKSSSSPLRILRLDGNLRMPEVGKSILRIVE